MSNESMRKTRRWSTRLTLLALPLALLAAACGGGGSGGAAGASATHVSVPKKPTTITFVSWVGSTKVMKQLAAQFHKKYPTITVNFINVSSDNEQQKLTTMVAGGTAPDVAYVDSSSVADFASRGALAPLNPFIAQSKVVKASEYVPAFRTMNTYQGNMYGLPFDGESTAIFYRKDLFKEAGVQCCPKTWAQFEADAKKLTDPAKKQYGFGMFGQESAYYWYPWLWSAGGHLTSSNGKNILFDSPTAVAAANYYIGLSKYSPPDYWNSNSYDARLAFPKGQTVMYEAGSWFGGSMEQEYPKIDGKWGTFPIPVKKKCATDIAGDSLVMFKSSQNTAAAWLWLQFLEQPSNVLRWNVDSPGSTELPPVTALLDNPKTFSQKPWLRGFAKNMSCGFTETQGVTQWPQVEQDLDNDLTKAIYGKVTPAQALDQGAQQARQVIASGGS